MVWTEPPEGVRNRNRATGALSAITFTLKVRVLARHRRVHLADDSEFCGYRRLAGRTGGRLSVRVTGAFIETAKMNGLSLAVAHGVAVDTSRRHRGLDSTRCLYLIGIRDVSQIPV